MEPIEEDPPKFEEQEEILKPEVILRHEDNLLGSGKTLRCYLVKFRNYPHEDAWWMQESQLKDSLDILHEYIFLYELDNQWNTDFAINSHVFVQFLILYLV